MDFSAALESSYGRFNFRKRFEADQPLLVHYTTVKVAEAIVANNEIWLSNPLFMNDIEELRFGIEVANDLIERSAEFVGAMPDASVRDAFFAAYRAYDRVFAEELALDVYVFCLSQHERDDFDGSLSMWRGYGAQGDGVALGFDTIPLIETDDETVGSALFAAPVFYGDETKRTEKLAEIIAEFVDILNAFRPSQEQVHQVAFHLHNCIVLQSLLMKHRCFIEEKEWRLIYLKHFDDEGELHDEIGYHIDDRGFAQPKLKFRVRPIKGMGRQTLHVRDLIERVIVGPSVAGPASLATFKRIVETHLGPGAAQKVRGSVIPFRSRLRTD